jgi:hypothetical protein
LPGVNLSETSLNSVRLPKISEILDVVSKKTTYSEPRHHYRLFIGMSARKEELWEEFF